MIEVKYFNKPLLIQAAKIAIERDYNRQLNVDVLDEKLDDDLLFPVAFSMLHEHRAGQLTDPHMRTQIVVSSDGSIVSLDVDLEFYNSLPRQKIAV